MKNIPRFSRQLTFFTLLLVCLNIYCNGSSDITVDPVNVQLERLPNGYLKANVVYNGTIYDEYSWPFGSPTFTWQEIDVQSTASYQVIYYNYNRTQVGLNLWQWASNEDEGNYYYNTHVQFTDGGSQQGNTPLYHKFPRFYNRTDYTETECYLASGYVMVPYVTGVINDEKGYPITKSLDYGYRGVDCSGLAWYCGYQGDEEVEYTDCDDLIEDYDKDLPLDSLELILPPNPDEGYLDGCMLFVNVDDKNHVGVILNQDATIYSQIFHATASITHEAQYSHGRMVMREEIEFRDYWVNDFVDIGRQPMN